MLYKAFLVLTIICCSAAIGRMGENRVKQRKQALCELCECVKRIGSLVTSQGMTVPEALFACGMGVFKRSAAAAEKAPAMGGEQVLKCAWRTDDAQLAELNGEDLRLMCAFMEAVFTSAGKEEVLSACSRCTSELKQLIREESEVRLKKARLKKAMFILGGIAISIILI